MTNTADDVHLDIEEGGFWEYQQESSIVVVRIFDPCAESYWHVPLPARWRRWKQPKRNAFEERVRQVERASFVLLVFTTSEITSSAANDGSQKAGSKFGIRRDTWIEQLHGHGLATMSAKRLPSSLCSDVLPRLLIPPHHGHRQSSKPCLLSSNGLILAPEVITVVHHLSLSTFSEVISESLLCLYSPYHPVSSTCATMCFGLLYLLLEAHVHNYLSLQFFSFVFFFFFFFFAVAYFINKVARVI